MENTNKETKDIILGIDHGYKNMKTRNVLYPTAISELECEPDDKTDILEYDGKFYTINGEPILSVDTRDKSDSDEYYLLTLVSIAKELQFRKETSKKIYITAGLPYKWYDNQKVNFKDKLESNKKVSFKFEGKQYDLEITGAKVFMQGLSAIANTKQFNEGYYILVDIGGETVDIVPVENRKVIRKDTKILTTATISLTKNISEMIQTELFNSIRESEIIDVIKRGTINENDEYEVIIGRELKKYSDFIFTELKKFGFNTSRENIVFIGGGASIIQKFGEYNKDKTFFITDMNANAKGYEYTESMIRLAKKGK